MTSLDVKTATKHIMERRKCNYCNGQIPPEKRADSKFCSNSCKANYWEQNKGKKKIPVITAIPEREKTKVQEMPLEGLRGIIENKPKADVIDVNEPSNSIVNLQVAPALNIETQAYKDAWAKKEYAHSDYLRNQKILDTCENYLQAWINERDKLEYTQPTNLFQPINVDAMALQGDFEEEVWETHDQSERQKEIEQHIFRLNDCKSQLEQRLPKAKKIYEEAQQHLLSTPQYEITKQNSPALMSRLINGVILKKLQHEEQQPELMQPIQEEDMPTESPVTILSNSKLISSRELREMNYKCLNFQSRWKDFFGLPAVVFHLAVHGKPGEGKSTFCIQFADYLAKNFGYVVYVSGEEGFSKTLRDKVVNNKIDNPYLFFADINSFEQIKTEIDNSKFHFIFIDSLDTLRIDAARLRELREYYPQSAFITISQSTKDGKMRGSQEIIHDADITVKVEDGTAVTTKNRYSPRGAEFGVFPTLTKPADKAMEEPRNLI